VDEIVRKVAELGQGTLLGEVDPESAYWLLPVHPQDRGAFIPYAEGSSYLTPKLVGIKAG